MGILACRSRHRHYSPPPSPAPLNEAGGLALVPPSTKSDFNVEVVQIAELRPHPNGDRIEIAIANGTPVVVRKGDYKVGDKAIYVPVDALVPLDNREFAFLASKSHPDRTHARIRAARFRGVYSEGLLVPLRPTLNAAPIESKWFVVDPPVGTNVQAELKIEKWLSPADRAESAGGILANPNSRRSKVVAFNKLCPIYGLDSIIRFPDAIPVGTPVVVTEKIHGSNARYSFQKGRFWVGSHRTLRHVTSHRIIEFLLRAFWAVATFFGFKKNVGYYSELGDIWMQMAEKYDLERKLATVPGLVVYGEIYGKGLQRRGGVDFVYDSPDGLKFRVFDMYDTEFGCFLPYNQMIDVCRGLDLLTVPNLHPGFIPWTGVAEEERLTKGNTLLSDGLATHIREGVVVRTDVVEPDPMRKALKFVSTDYKMLAED